MVLNRGPVVKENGEDILYDYSGCIYPNGLNPEEVFYFNQDNIDTVLFEGYDDEQRFVGLYEEWLETKGKLIKKEQILLCYLSACSFFVKL